MNGNWSASTFVAAALGLDFLNALASPPHSKIEPIVSSEGLMAWLVAADLVPLEALQGVQAIAVPGELDAVASQARTLGEWFRRFVCEYRGRPLPAAAMEKLEPLNRILERDLRFGQVAARTCDHGQQTPSGLAWCFRRQWRSPDFLLLPIAQTMAELVCQEDFTYVRKCERPGCSLLFLDRTPGHGRRWCNMASCGNRSKQPRAGEPLPVINDKDRENAMLLGLPAAGLSCQ